MSCLKSSDLWKETDKAYKKWTESKTIEKWGYTNDLPAFKKLFEASTKKELLAGFGITHKDMKKFQVGIENLEKDLRSPGVLSTKIMRNLYVGPALSMRNPALKDFFEVLVNANEYRNSHQYNMMTGYKKMMSSLKRAILEFDGTDTSSIEMGDKTRLRDIATPSAHRRKKDVRKVFDDLNNFEKKYFTKMKNGDSVGAVNELNLLMKFLDNEGSVFTDFIDRVVQKSESALVYKYRGQEKRRYINRINEAASEWRAVQDLSKDILVKSITNLTDIINLKYGRKSKVAEFLIKEYKGVANKLEEMEGGYIPHYVLDILGQSIEIKERMMEAKSDTAMDNILNEYVNATKEINTNLIQRLKAKSSKEMEYFSRNPVLYAQKYIQEVAQFNHSTFIDLAYTKGLKKFTEVIFRNPGTKEEKAAKVYQDILTDLYTRGSGKDRVESSPEADNITRLITALQFVAKLGWSTRGALRNATQRILNFGYLGGKVWKDAVVASRTDDAYKKAMLKELDFHGLKYVDISKVTEGVVTATDLTAYGIDYEKGMLTYRDRETILENLTRKGVKLAEASSLLTKWAENTNRKSTFNAAFYKRVQQLKGTNKYSNWESEPKILDSLHRRAGNYASKITSLLHFEYSPFGKSKILTTKVGSVLGLFMHYALSFANLQVQVAKDYKNAVRAGDYFGEELGRIIRFSSIYALSEVVSILLDTNFTSYINNDTLDRAKGLVDFLDSEDDDFKMIFTEGDLKKYIKKVKKSEASKEAFYGKGVVGALGVVPVSDLVEIHNLGAAAGYWKMLADEESTAGWLMGLRDYKKIDDLEFTKEVGGMFSIQAERILRRTLPAMLGNSPLTSVFRAELGLYPGTTTLGLKTRSLRKKYILPKKEFVPKKGGLTKEEQAQNVAQALSALAQLR